MTTPVTRRLSLRRSLVFTLLGCVLALMLAASALLRLCGRGLCRLAQLRTSEGRNTSC